MTVIESVDTASTTLRAIKELQQVDLLQAPTLSFCWKLGITVPHCPTVLGYTWEAFSFVCFMLLNLIYLIKLFYQALRPTFSLCILCFKNLNSRDTPADTTARHVGPCVSVFSVSWSVCLSVVSYRLHVAVQFSGRSASLNTIELTKWLRPKILNSLS